MHIYIYTGLPRQVYLGNLHPNITEEDLMELLRPFGTVTKLVMARNEDVRSSGGFGACACRRRPCWDDFPPPN